MISNFVIADIKEILFTGKFIDLYSHFDSYETLFEIFIEMRK